MQRTYPKVTIVGAGNVGATAALQLLSKDIADVVMIDVAEGVAKGKALDMMHMRSNEHFGPTVMGTGDYGDTAQSDIVVVTAGMPRKPGMTREDLIEINAKIVRDVLKNALPASPDAIYIFVTNPLDVMTNLAASLSNLPSNRIMGMGGVLDTARFIYAIAEATGAPQQDIEAMVIGAHGEAMVPLPSLATVSGKPLLEVLADKAELAQNAQAQNASVELSDYPYEADTLQTELDSIVEATVQGGAAVVRLLETGSAYYAPASSIAKMVTALIRDTQEVFSVCTKLNGEYGINDVYMCVPAVLGAGGVQSIVELPLASNELMQLQESAKTIKAMTQSASL